MVKATGKLTKLQRKVVARKGWMQLNHSPCDCPECKGKGRGHYVMHGKIYCKKHAKEITKND